MKQCKTCGKSTYKPKQRIYTKYCDLTCRNLDKEYWESISNTKSKQVISKGQREKISNSLKEHYKENPRPKKDMEYDRRYRSDCQFKFNLADYPAEFDFTLIEQYGWYKAKNRGDNLNGVSRDHIISVKDGLINNIDPKIIAHPANCRLVRHNDNVSKGKKSLLTIEELLAKIEKWNQKYT